MISFVRSGGIEFRTLKGRLLLGDSSDALIPLQELFNS